jgi:co-chaperonin GroES (HSP10)
MKLKPIGNKLVATLYEEPKKASLILSPETKPRDRFVIQSVVDNDMGLKKGDMILVEGLRFLEKEVEGEKVYIIKLENVMGIFE